MTSNTLTIKKGNVVARVSPRHDGTREISLYRVETAGRQNTRVRDYGRTSTTSTRNRDFFREDNAFVLTEAEADRYLEEMRGCLNSHPCNREGYFALVERTIAAHLS